MFTFDETDKYAGEPMAHNSKTVLWAAVQALMLKHYGKENLNRLAREAKFALATASRMKNQKTSVGLDVLDQMADKFKVEPWQLLVPGFDPDQPAALVTVSPMALDLALMLDAIKDDDQKHRAHALMVQVVAFGAGLGSEKAPSPSDKPTKTPLPNR